MVDGQSGTYMQGGELYTGNSDEATATFKPLITKPLLTARPVSMYDGSGGVDENLEKEGTWSGGRQTDAKVRPVLVATDNAGWRFRIGNDSASRMAPACFSVGPIPDGINTATITTVNTAGDKGTGTLVTPSLVPGATQKTPYFVTDRIRLGSAF